MKISKHVEEHIAKVLQEVKTKNSSEVEFLQAVEEVLNTLGPVLERHPEFVEENILGRIVEPEKGYQFRVAWRDKDGKLQVNKGFRYQFNSAIGPYKGELRFLQEQFNRLANGRR